MAGPAIRAYELARALAPHCRVTLAAPAPSELTASGIELLEAGLADYDALAGAVAEHDVVVAQSLPPRLLSRIWRLGTRLVVDLYNPIVVEVIEGTRHKPPASRDRLRSVVTRSATAHLAAADLVLCASERQRDLWLGGLALRELLEHDALERLQVVPFGIPAGPPAAGPAIRAALPAIPDDARILLWGGGIWNWLDAPTAIRAAAALSEDVHLVFQGVKRPAMHARDEHRAAAEAIALARELGLEGRRVHFNHEWVPYGQRGSWLLEADLGVCAHSEHLETRFAFRTRIVDYLWAGLPVVASSGDVLGDTIGARGLGRAVAPGDHEGFAAACTELLAESGPERERIRAIAPELRWDRVAEPLVEFCLHGAKRAATTARRRTVTAATLRQYGPIAAETLGTDGLANLTRKLGANAGRALRKR